MANKKVVLIDWKEKKSTAIVTIGDSKTKYSIKVPDDKNTSSDLAIQYIIAAANDIQSVLDAKASIPPALPNLNNFEGYTLNP